MGCSRRDGLTVDDLLACRVRILFIDAEEAIKVAPKVARLIASERNLGEEWIEEQIEIFTRLPKIT
ncbi:MAG: hypothetical protein ACRCZY_11310 [Phocaeicola sp.]